MARRAVPAKTSSTRKPAARPKPQAAPAAKAPAAKAPAAPAAKAKPAAAKPSAAKPAAGKVGASKTGAGKAGAGKPSAGKVAPARGAAMTGRMPGRAVAAAPAPAAKPAPKGRAAKLPVKRGIGRPPADGNAVGREKLLKTACDLLRTTPPNKLTRFMVAQKASVDPSLIRYYFRDRISLLAAAAERLMEQYTERLEEEAAPAGDGAAQLAERLTANVNLDVSYAHFRRLLLDELLASGAAAARNAANAIASQSLQPYKAIVEAGIADGSIREEDPALLLIAVMALSSYFPAAKAVYEAATGKKVTQQAMADKYRGFVTGLVGRGMAPGEAAKPRKAAAGKG